MLSSNESNNIAFVRYLDPALYCDFIPENRLWALQDL